MGCPNKDTAELMNAWLVHRNYILKGCKLKQQEAFKKEERLIKSSWIAGYRACEALQSNQGRPIPTEDDWCFDMEEAPRNGEWIELAWGKDNIRAKWLDNSSTSVPWQGWSPHSMVVLPIERPRAWRWIVPVPISSPNNSTEKE